LPQLRRDAVVGTGSPRRRAQLKALRPDLRFSELRGNIGTRIRKVEDGRCDATVLAAAGLHRAGLLGRADVIFSPTHMLPAPGQGALAVECRKNDRQTRALLSPLHDLNAALCVEAERAVLQGLGGGCGAPLGALARYHLKQKRLTLQLALELHQPRRLVRTKASIPVSSQKLKKNPTLVFKAVKSIARNLARKLAVD
jgi:hydroxymethylbilane synthase